MNLPIISAVPPTDAPDGVPDAPDGVPDAPDGVPDAPIYRWSYKLMELLKGKEIDKICVLSRDISKSNANKGYITFPIEEFEKEINERLKINNYLYELIPENTLIKLYFDLEIEEEIINPIEKLQLFIVFLKDIIQKYFLIEITQEDLLILDSCKKGKLSYHLIIQNKICFENINTLSYFILLMKNELIINPLFGALIWKKKEETRVIFDVLPYKRNQNFRLINQSKRNEPIRPLTLFTAPTENFQFTDTLVRLYHGEGNKKIIKKIDFMINDIAVSTTSSSTKKQTTPSSAVNKKIEDKEFVTHGITLQQQKCITEAEIRTYPEWKQYLYIIPNTTQTRNIFLYVGFALKTVGGTKEDYEEWAKLSTKYTQGRTVKQFNIFNKKDTRPFNLPFLKRLAKEANPEYFDMGLSHLKNYFNPDFKNIKIITEDCDYVSQQNTIYENDIMAEEEIILLKAHLGKGKTQAILRLINTEKYKRILVLSPRIAFGRFISNEFNTEFYLNEKDDNPNYLKSDRLTISMESLYKLKELNVDNYDMIILDEIEANLSCFSSSTMKYTMEVYDILIYFIKHAKKIIMAGAFITQKTIDFIVSLKKTTVCINNIRLPDPKKSIRKHEILIIDELIERIKKGEKNYAFFSVLDTMKYFINKLKTDNIKNNGKYTQIIDRLLCYSRETKDDKITTDTLINMLEEWKHASNVITTPKLTVGTSYDPNCPDFHNIFIIGAPSCIVADVFQGHRRVRKTINNILFYSLPEKTKMDLNKRFYKHRMEIINTWDEREKTRYTKISTLLGELIVYNTNCSVKNPAQLKLLTQIYNNFNTTNPQPEALMDIMMFNFKEQVLSDCYYEEMFLKMLEINNYENITNEDDLNTDKTRENVENHDSIKYKDIPEINEMTANEFKIKQTKGISKYIEKLQVLKYCFMSLQFTITDEHNTVITNTNDNYEDVLQFYWEMYLKEYSRKYLYNMKMEMNSNIQEQIILNTSNKDKCHNDTLKLSYILKINQALGIPHTNIDNINIKREQIENLNEYLKKEIVNINTIFNLTKKTTAKKWEFSQSFALIQAIYKNWNKYLFIVSKKHERTHQILELRTYNENIFKTKKDQQQQQHKFKLVYIKTIPTFIGFPIHEINTPDIENEIERITKQHEENKRQRELEYEEIIKKIKNKKIEYNDDDYEEEEKKEEKKEENPKEKEKDKPLENFIKKYYKDK